MIRVTSNVIYNHDMHCTEITTRVIVGTENGACIDCSRKIIKAELKALISSLLDKQPGLLFSALEEVIEEGLTSND